MDVLLVRSWETNMGNSIIEMGARSMIRQAVPGARIIETSGYPHYLSARRSSASPLNLISDLKIGVKKMPVVGKLAKRIYNNVKNLQSGAGTEPAWIERWKPDENIRSVGEFIDADVAVIPGCVLRSGLAILRPILQKLNERDIPIIFLGAAGGSYSSSAQTGVKNILERYNPHTIIARDRHAYDCYSEYAETSHLGLDCGLFINDWYSPPEVRDDFTVLTFDKTSEPKIKNENIIIRPNHAPYNNPEIGYSNWLDGISKSSYFEPIQKGYFDQNNIFVSDNVKDYLFFYKNCDRVYSDRIHACIPALAYGNQAKFHFDTPRQSLFDELEKRSILDKNISSELVSANQPNLKEEKQEEIDKLGQFIKQAVGY